MPGHEHGRNRGKIDDLFEVLVPDCARRFLQGPRPRQESTHARSSIPDCHCRIPD